MIPFDEVVTKMYTTAGPKDLLERKCQVVNLAEFRLKCFQSLRKSGRMTINKF